MRTGAGWYQPARIRPKSADAKSGRGRVSGRELLQVRLGRLAPPRVRREVAGALERPPRPLLVPALEHQAPQLALEVAPHLGQVETGPVPELLHLLERAVRRTPRGDLLPRVPLLDEEQPPLRLRLEEDVGAVVLAVPGLLREPLVRGP